MKICYFGTYNPLESRNRIYMKGFREHDAEIIECRASGWGPIKFWNLFWKHWKIRKSYDVLIVGYPGHVLVPFAGLISSKLVVFDALCTMYEGVIISRGQFRAWSPKTLYIRAVDFLAVRFADAVLVESQAQKKYFEEKFNDGHFSKKYQVVYTGADDSVFYVDPVIKKREKFTAIFRGKFLPEAGARHIVETAKLLENERVDVIIMGHGWLEDEIREQIKDLNLKNVELISSWLPEAEVREKMLECHLSLGQFEEHERLERTIPHKAYESLATGLPYITAKSAGIGEILMNEVDCLMVPKASPRAIFEAIMRLRDDPSLAQKLSLAGLQLFHHKFRPFILSQQILDIVKECE